MTRSPFHMDDEGSSRGSQDHLCADAGPDSPRSPRFAPRTWEQRLAARPLTLIEGETYEAWHPFKLEEFHPFPDEDPHSGGSFCAPASVSTWVPGWRYEACGPEDVEEVWDGEGVQLRTIVSIHKPGRYPTRVFYVRQWRGPDGRVFGKTNLRVVVAPTFRAWLFGERWPGFSPARKAHADWAKRGAARADGPRVAAQVSQPFREANQ